MLRIEVMCVDDLAEVVALNGVASAYSWTLTQFTDSLLKHDCWVLRSTDQLLGFVILQHVCNESCVLNVAVHPAFHRQGYASYLLSFCLQLCRNKQSEQCYLEVRQSNTAAKALYARMGFINAGKRKNYYPLADGYEDAEILIKSLIPGDGE